MEDNQIKSVKILKLIGLIFLLLAVVGQFLGASQSLVNYGFSFFFVVAFYIFVFSIIRGLFYRPK